VPANADVDQVGRFDAKGDVTLGTGFVDWCVRLYNGVSDGDSRNRWCDIFSNQGIVYRRYNPVRVVLVS
jgi:hypothetical protein